MAVKIVRTIKAVDRKRGIVSYVEDPTVARLELFPRAEAGQRWELEVDRDGQLSMGRIKSAHLLANEAK